MNVITKLAAGSIKSHKLRSSIICAAAVLTCVLFMTVVSITFNIFSGAQLILMLASGSDFHAIVSGRDLTISAEELLEIIKSDKAVGEAYIISRVGETKTDGGKSRASVFAVDSKKALNRLFINITDGRFPDDGGGIAINKTLFPDIKIGDAFSFESTEIKENTDGSFKYENLTHDYTVTALFECESDKGAQPAGLTCYAAEANSAVYFNFTNSLNISGKYDALTEQLQKYVETGKELHSNVNNAYLSADSSVFSVQNFILVIFSVAVVFFCAFLLIYNIYSIALTQEMRSFGLLGVVGATYKQLKSLIRRQTLILYVFSAPVGIIAGYFVGWKLLSPVFMSLSGKKLNYRFSGWIIVLGAAFTLFTLMYSALCPMKRIKKLTPVEAVNENGCPIFKKGHKPSGINPVRLAFYSAGRNPRRLIITSLSAALSVILLLLVSSFVTLTKNIGAAELSLTDIRIAPVRETNYGETAEMLGAENCRIDEEVYEKLKTLDGADGVWAIRYAQTDIAASEKNIADAKTMLDRIPAENREMFGTERLEQIADGSIHAIFISIPDELCGYIKTGDGEYYSDDELYDGAHALSLENYNSFFIESGDGYVEYELPELFEGGDIISSDNLTRTYTLIKPDLKYPYNAVSDITGYFIWDYCVALFVMPESVFKNEFNESEIYTVLCDYGGEDENDFRSEVEAIAQGYGVSGRFDDLAELQGRIFAIGVTGYSLCFMIFIIGAMNMVNSSLSTVTERRREYAMLEAVGMTGTQMRTMILTEGFIGGIISTLITLLAGVPAVKAFMQASVDSTSVEIWPAAVMLVLLFAVSAVASLISLHEIRRTSVTDRLRTE